MLNLETKLFSRSKYSQFPFNLSANCNIPCKSKCCCHYNAWRVQQPYINLLELNWLISHARKADLNKMCFCACVCVCLPIKKKLRFTCSCISMQNIVLFDIFYFSVSISLHSIFFLLWYFYFKPSDDDDHDKKKLLFLWNMSLAIQGRFESAMTSSSSSWYHHADRSVGMCIKWSPTAAVNSKCNTIFFYFLFWSYKYTQHPEWSLHICTFT